MADSKHVEILRQGSEQWNKWRKRNSLVQPDLSGAILNRAILNEADLSNTDLRGADLFEAHLRRANLRGTNLIRANLRGVHLRGANLRGVPLIRANLSEADLSGAILSRANLSEANLSEADLSKTNLSEAEMYRTILIGIDLRTTKGLATIVHHGPSRIELFSVQLPQDGSALHFLRGVGVPDEWIDFWRTTMMHPIQYHSCFISYAGNDELVARRLHADLQAEGIRCWFAPEDMKNGDRFRQRIDEAIHVQDKVLLLLSQSALESEWVETEVEVALYREQKQKRDILVPIRLDESVLKAEQVWAKHLRLKRHIGDFTKWADPQEYASAFERLLRDLKQ